MIASPSSPQFYGIKTADNAGLFKVVEGPLPEGANPSEFWPVDPTVPVGYFQPGGQWKLENGVVLPVVLPLPSPPPRRQETDTILRRLTSAEYQALHAAKNSNWAIDRLLMRAVATGVIDESDPDFPAAVTGLDSVGAIAASRWDALLAP